MLGAWDSLRKQGIFDKSERNQFLVTVVFITVAFFLFWWRIQDLNALTGILYFIGFFIAALFFMFIYVFFQKLKGAQMGYKVRYGYWMPGLLITFVINILTQGAFPLFVPGTVTATTVDRDRIGKFRGRFSYVNLNVISLFGPFACILIVLLLKPIHFWVGGGHDTFIYYMILMTILIALYSLVPYPFSVGMNLFRSMRWSWVWAVAIGLAYSLLIIIGNAFSYIMAFIIGTVALILFHALFEQKKGW